jgi:cytochrome c553
MSRSLLLIPALCCAAMATQAAPPALPAAQSLAATCFNCHGPHGVSTTAIPSLAGRPAASIVSLMTEYKSGQRPGTIMPQIAKGYTDTQIQLIAEYFAQQHP